VVRNGEQIVSVRNQCKNVNEGKCKSLVRGLFVSVGAVWPSVVVMSPGSHAGQKTSSRLAMIR
jgi:hypothetical protein